MSRGDSMKKAIICFVAGLFITSFLAGFLALGAETILGATIFGKSQVCQIGGDEITLQEWASNALAHESFGEEVILKVPLPEWYLVNRHMAGGNTYQAIVAPGMATLEVGKPNVPAFGKWIKIPNGKVTT